MSREAEEPAWNGKVAMEPGRLVYFGALGGAHLHQHLAIQVVVALSGAVRLSDDEGRVVETSAAVIPGGTRHAIAAAPGVTGLLVFLDPTAAAHRFLALSLGHGTPAEWARMGDPLRRLDLGLPSPASLADTVVGELSSAASAETPRHPAVTDALVRISETIPDPMRLTQVAADVALSPSRLGRLFGAQIGLSFPAYVRWIRLQRAMESLGTGATLTVASHAAGFSDSAHANRVCHEMFGVAPSEVAGGLGWG